MLLCFIRFWRTPCHHKFLVQPGPQLGLLCQRGYFSVSYGLEFLVAQQGVEHLIDLRYTMCLFGVPLDGPAWMFGANQSVVTSSMISHSTLGKRWNVIASGWLRFEHIVRTENLVETKPLAWFVLHIFVEPFLYWKRGTMEAGASCPPGGSTNLEGSDVDPSLAQDRDLSEMVTSGCDVNRNS